LVSSWYQFGSILAWYQFGINLIFTWKSELKLKLLDLYGLYVDEMNLG
jgi:hypothetical protein